MPDNKKPDPKLLELIRSRAGKTIVDTIAKQMEAEPVEKNALPTATTSTNKVPTQSGAKPDEKNTSPAITKTKVVSLGPVKNALSLYLGCMAKKKSRKSKNNENYKS